MSLRAGPTSGTWARALVAMGAAIGLGCGGDAPAPSSASGGVEDGPAMPCSINGMLARDVERLSFERCGRSELPLTGPAKDCLADAVQARRPAIVELEGGGVGGGLRRAAGGASAALVLADFGLERVEGGALQLRLYTQTGPTSGQRSEAELMMSSADAQALELRASLGRELECVMSTSPPEATAWRNAGPHRKVLGHGGPHQDALGHGGPHQDVLGHGGPHQDALSPDAQRCVEWFDLDAWRTQPWASRFDPTQRLSCVLD